MTLRHTCRRCGDPMPGKAEACKPCLDELQRWLDGDERGRDIVYQALSMIPPDMLLGQGLDEIRDILGLGDTDFELLQRAARPGPRS